MGKYHADWLQFRAEFKKKFFPKGWEDKFTESEKLESAVRAKKYEEYLATLSDEDLKADVAFFVRADKLIDEVSRDLDKRENLLKAQELSKEREQVDPF